MDVDSYYRDHWVSIEPGRLERYAKTFRITGANRAMWFDVLGIAPGEIVVDFGCGPGYVSVEAAEVVGPDGHVHGLDLNSDMLAVAEQVAAERGVADRVTFHQVTDARIPLPDASVDRVVFKSVLLYVPDIDATLAEAVRVLKPGGVVLAHDSDFGLTACTAYTSDEWAAFLAAVRPAFRDPTMGRNLRGALRRAGLVDVSTKASTFADDRGATRGTLENFFGYAKELGTLSAAEVEEMAERADRAIADGDWLFVITFFRVEGTKPAA